MALIKCPECSREVSEQATACPNCGYPVNRMNKTYENHNKNSGANYPRSQPELYEPDEDKKGLLGFIFALVSLFLPIAIIDVLIGIAAFVLSMMGSKKGMKYRGLAIAGIVISAFATIGGIMLLMEYPEIYYF